MATITRRLFGQLLIGASVAFGFLGQRGWHTEKPPDITPEVVNTETLWTHVQVAEFDGMKERILEWVPNEEFFGAATRIPYLNG